MGGGEGAERAGDSGYHHFFDGTSNGRALREQNEKNRNVAYERNLSTNGQV